jgi:lipid II:glycine glycyltransferase (peptidoglycan interpeptide bridge formation enzyme)
MSKYKVEKIWDKRVWERFVLSKNPQSFLQSWNWGETNKLMGNKVLRLGFYYGKVLVGVCLLIKQEAKRGSHFLIPGGPLMNWKDKKLINLFVKEIKKIGKSEGVWFIRARPELLNTGENDQLFKKLGFVSAPMHLHAENTWVLNLKKTQNELLANMRKNTRYSVRKSLEKGIELIESDNFADVKILASLQEETVRRHKFTGFPAKFFKAQLEAFGVDDQAKLFLCKKDNQILVAAIIIFYGDIAYYHHSASNEKARALLASYYLQWRVIQEAKKRGCKEYNFWGVAPTDNPRHRFYGVTVFKKGFGGRQIDWLHAQDLPISLFYPITYLFERGRKAVRRL